MNSEWGSIISISPDKTKIQNVWDSLKIQVFSEIKIKVAESP